MDGTSAARNKACSCSADVAEEAISGSWKSTKKLQHLQPSNRAIEDRELGAKQNYLRADNFAGVF